MKTILSPYYKIISKKKRLLQIRLWLALILLMSRGVIGNTSGFGPDFGESCSSETTPFKVMFIKLIGNQTAI